MCHRTSQHGLYDHHRLKIVYPHALWDIMFCFSDMFLLILGWHLCPQCVCISGTKSWMKSLQQQHQGQRKYFITVNLLLVVLGETQWGLLIWMGHCCDRSKTCVRVAPCLTVRGPLPVWIMLVVSYSRPRHLLAALLCLCSWMTLTVEGKVCDSGSAGRIR